MNHKDNLALRACQNVQDECLRMLADYHKMDYAELANMNTLELQNKFISWKYEVVPIDVNKHLPTVTPPEDGACGKGITTCEGAYVEYEDVLYVPNHPKDGKRYWYALTSEALERLKQERQHLQLSDMDINAPDFNEKMLQKLNELGLLSRYDYLPYEIFLSDAADKERYKTLWLLKWTQGLGLWVKAELNELDDYARSVGFELLAKYSFIKSEVELRVRAANHYPSGSLDSLNTQYVLGEARKKIELELKEYVLAECKKLEDKAKKQANGWETDDGTKFIYDENLDYFTSDKEKNIGLYVSSLKRTLGFEYKSLASQSDSEAAKTVNYFWGEEFVQYDDILNESEISWSKLSSLSGSLGYDARKYGFYWNLLMFNLSGMVLKEQCLTLEELNNNNLYKEMFSSYRQYSKKYNAVINVRRSSFFGNDELNNEQVELLFELLQKDRKQKHFEQSDDYVWLKAFMESGGFQWGYWDTVALDIKLDAFWEKQVKDLRQIKLESIPDFFEKPLLIKKACKVRMDYWKALANSRAQKGDVSNISKKVNKESYSVLWNFEDWRPAVKHPGMIMNLPDNNDLRVVECYLLSEGDEGTPFYLRTPSWLLPASSEKHLVSSGKGHVKDISQRVALSASTKAVESKEERDELNAAEAQQKEPKLNQFPKDVAETVKQTKVRLPKDAYKKFMNQISENKQLSLDMSLIHFQNEHSLLGKDWAYQSNTSMDGYTVSADAQLMRFTSSATSSLTAPGLAIQGSEVAKRLSGDTALNLSLDLARAQLGFSAWFPLGNKAPGNAYVPYNPMPVKGLQLDFPYIARKSGNEVKQLYQAGEICFWLQVTTYGLIAASLNLATNISIGPSSDGNDVGVKGSAFRPSGYNRSKIKAEGPENVIEGAAQAGATAELFAGAEVGGTVTGEVHWKPPMSSDVLDKKQEKEAKETKQDKEQLNTNQWRKLGSITAGGAAGIGIGVEGTFRLGYDAGCFFLVVGAKVVCGPGVKGSLNIAIDPFSTDLFVGCLLNMLKQSGFSRLAVFDDEDSKLFYILNQRLTLAIATGLSLADILLFPPRVYADWLHKSTQEDYAPIIADRILEARLHKKTRTWLKDSPPETLAALFDTLIASPGGNRSGTQAEALLFIMQQLQPGDDTREVVLRRRQFTKALELMGVKEGQEAASYLRRWQRVLDNWLKLANFFSKIDGRIGEDKRDNIRDDFNKYVGLLCSGMCWYSNEWDELGVGRDGKPKISRKSAYGCYLSPEGLQAMVDAKIVDPDSQKYRTLQESLSEAENLAMFERRRNGTFKQRTWSLTELDTLLPPSRTKKIEGLF
ncbi:hypothetical protein [Shewanella algae]|uniref:hypothetical protein n=1 Tax=Shewanella algae TaxID=38313 RepID=UPI0031F55823